MQKQRMSIQKQQIKGVALTEREHVICTLLQQGHPQHEIAEQLVVEPGTVHWHTCTIRGKFGVGSTNELLRVLMSE